jgi:hypothetical protein
MRYFTRKDGTERGPYEVAALRESFRDGRLSPMIEVRPEGNDDWQLARDVSEIAESGDVRRRRRERKEALAKGEPDPEDQEIEAHKN